jgi:hypothetical protein
MHASVRRAAFTYGILAAIFIATSLCVFAVLAMMGPAKSPPRPPSFTIASHNPPAASRRRLAKLEPHENAEIENQLLPVSVRCSVSGAFPLGESREITLTLEKGQHGAASDPDNPRPCSAEPQTIRLATDVWILLQGAPDAVKIAPLDEKQYPVTPAGPVKWTWYVTPLQPGTVDAGIVVSTEVKLAGRPEKVQAWTPPLKIPVAVGVGGAFRYAMDRINANPLVSSLVVGLVMTLGTAVFGILRGWFGLLIRRKPRQDAQLFT